MARPVKKRDFSVHGVRRYLEPRPIVLVSSKWRGRTNNMTSGWHVVLEFTPSLIGLMISSGNHSHDMVRRSKDIGSAGQAANTRNASMI
ncbi:flavin reductase [Reyranella sp.]|uniref:flavin reductase n=1 Tax=Reyranella sp. TaxID=1929291 RepID=UPI003D0F650E